MIFEDVHFSFGQPFQRSVNEELGADYLESLHKDKRSHKLVPEQLAVVHLNILVFTFATILLSVFCFFFCGLANFSFNQSRDFH